MEILNTLEDKVQSTIQKISALQSRIDVLEAENAEYRQRLEAINSQLSSIDASVSTEKSDNATPYEKDEPQAQESAGYGVSY